MCVCMYIHKCACVCVFTDAQSKWNCVYSSCVCANMCVPVCVCSQVHNQNGIVGIVRVYMHSQMGRFFLLGCFVFCF